MLSSRFLMVNRYLLRPQQTALDVPITLCYGKEARREFTAYDNHYPARLPLSSRSRRKQLTGRWMDYYYLDGGFISMLEEISVLYSMVHMLVLFFLVYEFRCSRRTFILATSLVIGSISMAVAWILFHWGIAAAGQYGMVIAALPTLIYFFLMSKERNARFVFIFCMADTIAIWIQLFSAIVDYVLLGDGLVTFLLRLVMFPVAEYALWRWGRRPFFEMLHTIRRGWTLFAIMTGVSYLLLAQVSVYPSSLLDRPEDIPIAAMILALVALTYTTIFLVLHGQLKVFHAQERQRILEVQASMMERRALEVRQTEEQLAIERHDLRHRLLTVASLVEQGDPSAAMEYIGASQTVLDQSRRQHYCKNIVLDAILSSYFEQAARLEIAVEARLDIPDELPVDSTELSTVFANALENAIHACGQLPPDQRSILCTCAAKPRFIFEIANPCGASIRFGPDGLPQSDRDGHGLGVRSITAFAEKHGAVCRFRD